ncbi:MAG: adenylyltransferase/cytidyltransferase family protein [Candidatus Nanohaloarchaea archaeon]|nr:adenylyltransferase/cytidyltransferase family protein [Candidatus Nanohaloarchaea archaeon]
MHSESSEETGDVKVLANGVFDLLHPGHVHYLESSRELGDRLYVVLSRDCLIDKNPAMEEEDRLRVVEALECVDHAFLGFEEPGEHIYKTMEKVDPDIVTLGYDQSFDPEELEEDLMEHGFEVKVVRISSIPDREISSTKIKQKVVDNI